MSEEAQIMEEPQNIDVEITDEKIEKAALPENRRVEEEVQDNPVEVEVSQNVAPVSEDEIQEDFEAIRCRKKSSISTKQNKQSCSTSQRVSKKRTNGCSIR